MQKRQGATTDSSLCSFPISSNSTRPRLSMSNDQPKSFHTRDAIHNLLATLKTEKKQNVSSLYPYPEFEAVPMKQKTVPDKSAFHNRRNTEKDRGYELTGHPQKNGSHRSYCQASRSKRKTKEKLRPLNSFIAFRSTFVY